jgi:hypothetical protein
MTSDRASVFNCLSRSILTGKSSRLIRFKKSSKHVNFFSKITEITIANSLKTSMWIVLIKVDRGYTEQCIPIPLHLAGSFWRTRERAWLESIGYHLVVLHTRAPPLLAT